jgi:solute carrier family 9B (sodium/hydrogen exchanger), member 1/2
MSLEFTFFIILLGGWITGKIFSKINLPAVLGMLIWGIFLGFFYKSLFPSSLFEIEHFLKSFALVVILLRSGLGIHKSTIKKQGKIIIKLAFLPCVLEGLALTFAVHYIFNIEWLMSALTAFMLSAVSPAIIVPSMLSLREKVFKQNKEVPTIILAGSSLDDVFAISIFSIILNIVVSGTINKFLLFFSIPLSIFLGLLPGIILGYLLVKFCQRNKKYIQTTEIVLVLLTLSFLLIHIGNILQSASLLGIMAIGFILLEKEDNLANKISNKLSKIWIFAEIILFVLIGISVDIQIAWQLGYKGILVILFGLCFRVVGVYFSLWGSSLNYKEKLFCAIAYTPKATVQAALGGVALSMGLPHGNTILAIAVLAIIITAPLGLIGIKVSANKLLH